MAFNVGTGEVVKIDLVGSTHQVGLTSYRHDRAIRRCIVTNLGISDDGSPDEHDILSRATSLAIVAATGSGGGTQLFHHIITTLPLQQARARQRGRNSVWVDLIYARGRWASLPSAANVIASSRTEYIPTPMYRLPYTVSGNGTPEPAFEDGLPNGDLYVIEPTNTGRLTGIPRAKFEYRRPQTYMWERPVILFKLPTFRASNPILQIDQLIGKTNDEQIEIGGVGFPINSIKLEAPDVNWTSEKTGGDWFEIDYTLIGAPDLFNVQHVRIGREGEVDDDGNSVEDLWVTTNGPEFAQGNFAPLLGVL